MKKLIVLSILMIIMFSTTLLAGCTSANITPDDSVVDEPAAEEPVAEETVVGESVEGELVELQLYSFAWLDETINTMKALVERFNAENEGEIHIEYIQGSYGDADTYITAGVAAGGGIADLIEHQVEFALD